MIYEHTDNDSNRQLRQTTAPMMFMNDADAEMTTNNITAQYYETESERILTFERSGTTAAIAQNIDGYAMVMVRPTPEGEELERYYGFDMALDHASELLDVSVNELPVPKSAMDMGM
jgi:hypothetical protein